MNDVAEYKQVAKTTESFLDPHHTHFILVDNDENGSEIDFRSKFESRQLYSGCDCFPYYDANYFSRWKISNKDSIGLQVRAVELA